MSNPAYGSKFQRVVLHYMTKDYVFCQKCCVFLEDKFFIGELQWFYRKIREHFTNHNAIIGYGDLDLEIAKHNENSKTYEDEWKLIEVDPNFSFDKIKKELTGFVRANEFISIYQEASQLFNAGSHKNAYEFTKDQLDNLLKKDFEDSKITRFGDSEQVCDQAAKQSLNAIPTGIHYIDRAMLGGLMPQTWTTFLGGSNVGKSMLCPNLAYHAAKAEKKVFVTVHEDEEIPTKIRYIARFSGVPINVLAQPRSTWSAEIALKVKEADMVLKKYVRIQFMYGQDCFIENVAEAACNQKIEWDFDLLLCDTGQCLKSRKYKELSDKYGLQEYIYSELKQVCLELYIAGAGGAQINRMGHKVNKSGTSLIRMTDVGDSWGICKKSSNVITMNRSDEDVRDHRITFLLDKVRNGKCPIATVCGTDYERSVTHVEFKENEATQQEVEVENDTRR